TTIGPVWRIKDARRESASTTRPSRTGDSAERDRNAIALHAVGALRRTSAFGEAQNESSALTVDNPLGCSRLSDRDAPGYLGMDKDLSSANIRIAHLCLAFFRR